MRIVIHFLTAALVAMKWCMIPPAYTATWLFWETKLDIIVITWSTIANRPVSNFVSGHFVVAMFPLEHLQMLEHDVPILVQYRKLNSSNKLSCSSIIYAFTHLHHLMILKTFTSAPILLILKLSYILFHIPHRNFDFCIHYISVSTRAVSYTTSLFTYYNINIFIVCICCKPYW